MTTIHIDLEDTLLRAVDNKLSARGISVSDAVQQWLEGLASESAQTVSEGRYAAELQEDMARWQKYQETGVCIPQDEMKEWADSLVDGARNGSGE
jgi:hypothetical protein